MRLQFDDAVLTDAVFAVSEETRTITGLAVPWNQSAKSGGKSWRFARGSIRWASEKRVKLLRDHDNTQAFGFATKIEDTDAGLIATFKVARGPEGDRLLAMAADGVLDGLSIGVNFRDEDTGPDPHHPGGFVVSAAALREVSLTAMPAFDDSRLTSVRASQQGEQEPVMPENEKQEQAPVTPAAPTNPTPAPAPAPTNPAPAPAEPAKQEGGQATFAMTQDQLNQLIAGINAAPAAQAAPVPAAVAADRPVVNPTAPVAQAAAFVSEPLPYQFTRESGRYVFSSATEHDFSADLFHMINEGVKHGPEAKRVKALIDAAFAVTTTNVSGLMPKQQRPDLWQPQMDYATPLWDMINSGTTDGTPFELPKYDSSSGLVSAAVEGVEPAPGAFAVTTQTITPSALWGKVELTRHAVRRGGNPQTSGVVWEQMLRSFFEAREAAVATFLNTLVGTAQSITLAVPTGPADNDEDQATVTSLEQAIADLQFVRGGNRFSAFAVHQFLYRILARVKDDAGRPLFPMIAPQNANGTTSSLYRSMEVGGTTAVGAWALGPATGTDPVNSWLFDPAKVRGWGSTPDRLDWDFGSLVQNTNVTGNLPQLSMVTIGLFADIAFGCIDINGVRRVITDPVGS